jgi:hypothetical protein
MPTLWICGDCVNLFEEVRSKVSSVAKSDHVNVEVFWCVNHWRELVEELPWSNEKKEQSVSKWKSSRNCPPDLREHPELVEAYSQGNLAAFPSAYVVPSPTGKHPLPQ